MTGARIARAAKYMGESAHAAVTYGDGLSNVDLCAELAFHLQHGKMGTILGVNPPSRFGEIHSEEDNVLQFLEKPDFAEKWINGGFFFFKKEFFKHYLSEDENCILERAPLVRLAQDRQLNIFKHKGFWGCMDTQRDLEQLNQLWRSGRAPWLAASEERL
jgi:glucose-1-phosphate cytidylyltransferase